MVAAKTKKLAKFDDTELVTQLLTVKAQAQDVLSKHCVRFMELNPWVNYMAFDYGFSSSRLTKITLIGADEDLMVDFIKSRIQNSWMTALCSQGNETARLNVEWSSNTEEYKALKILFAGKEFIVDSADGCTISVISQSYNSPVNHFGYDLSSSVCARTHDFLKASKPIVPGKRYSPAGDGLDFLGIEALHLFAYSENLTTWPVIDKNGNDVSLIRILDKY
jgi:hypothetical protein